MCTTVFYGVCGECLSAGANSLPGGRSGEDGA
jgi:hypothetical protein